jgi:hypothetical protein
MPSRPISGGSRVIWTGWKNGKHNQVGTEYGFRLSEEDRDKHFSPDWETVTVELPRGADFVKVETNVKNQSFWEGCCELRSKDIRRWMYDEGHAPWPNRAPAKFQVVSIGKGRFRVKRAI